MTDIQTCLENAVAAINAPSGNLYDVTIICTTDDHQADYWMNKLSEGVCKKPDSAASSAFPMVLAVSEDWAAGGAGNGLGTLYAYTKAAKLAKEKPGQTIQPTVLVHEAYLRLVKVDKPQQWNCRGHFFSAAAEAMRRILIDNARRKRSVRHGGEHRRTEVEFADLGTAERDEELLALDEALTRFEQRWPDKAKL